MPRKRKEEPSNVGIRKSVAQALSRYCDDRGLIQRDVLGRLVECFLRLPAPVQRAMRSDVDEVAATFYVELLESLAGQLRKREKSPLTDEMFKIGVIPETVTPRSQQSAPDTSPPAAAPKRR